MHTQICPIRAGLGVISLAEVRLQEGESLENALPRFKRKVQTEDIIKSESQIRLRKRSRCCQTATFHSDRFLNTHSIKSLCVAILINN
jgi:ribosomal protein S21